MRETPVRETKGGQEGVLRWALTAALLLAPLAPAWSSGLRTPFGEVEVKQLKIGQTYSLYKLVNLPLRLVNTGDDTLDVSIEVVRVSSDQLKAGFDPIGSLDWVRVESGRAVIAPKQEAVSDVIIAIPNDPALLGRRFEADIWSRSRSRRGPVGVGLRSRLLLVIDSTPPSEDELKKKFVDERLANLDFTVLPTEGAAAGVALGREVDLRKERKLSIKLINPNDAALNFRVRSIPVWESSLTAPEGAENAFNPQWLRPDREIVKVEGNSIGETGLRLSIPDEARLRGKRFFFVVGIDVLEQRIPTRVYYRLLIETASAAAEDQTKTKNQGEQK